MPGWAKYLTSLGLGFATTYATTKSTGASTGSSTFAGIVGALVSVGNLSTTSPGDHKALGRK